jgi:hypothetical protein
MPISLFVSGLFNDAVISSDSMASSGWMIMNSKLEVMCEKRFGLIEDTAPHLPGGTEEKH